MPNRARIYGIAINTCLCGILLSWAFYDNWYFLFPPHIIYGNIEVVTPIIKEGTKVHIRFTTTRTALCNPTVIRFFRLQPGDTIVKIGSSPAAAGGVGEKIRTSALIPGSNELEPGEYCVSGYVSNDCSGKDIQVKSPRYCFKVVPK